MHYFDFHIYANFELNFVDGFAINYYERNCYLKELGDDANLYDDVDHQLLRKDDESMDNS